MPIWYEGGVMDFRLVMCVAWTPEFREAPEFQRLQRWVRSEAEHVWSDVVWVEALPSDGAGCELLIVGERCLVGRRSMAAMRQALRSGASAAVPRRLASSGLPGLETVRTLRAIERAEQAFLSTHRPTEASEPPPYPAVLLSADAATALQVHEAAAILAGEEAPVVPVTGGLCHEFIDYYGEVREDILPLLDTECREVLEIGCGRGATGDFLQRRLGCRVTGVELNPVVARAATDRLHRVVVGDALEVDPGGPFDAVVACELFEHLVDSEEFLQRLQTWLRPGGRAVLSVPNVGHHAIVEDLMAGRWDYLPVGLLCSTHYRFFTRRTLEDTLRAAGLTDFEIVAQRSEEPDWLDELPVGLEVDAESLSTTGYYVVIRVP
jgi:SAM-dependent methyltransferase